MQLCENVNLLCTFSYNNVPPRRYLFMAICQQSSVLSPFSLWWSLQEGLKKFRRSRVHQTFNYDCHLQATEESTLTASLSLNQIQDNFFPTFFPLSRSLVIQGNVFEEVILLLMQSPIIDGRRIDIDLCNNYLTCHRSLGMNFSPIRTTQRIYTYMHFSWYC